MYNHCYGNTSHSPGSLLVAAAHFGGYVLGGDIDRVLVHGRGEGLRDQSAFVVGVTSAVLGVGRTDIQGRHRPEMER